MKVKISALLLAAIFGSTALSAVAESLSIDPTHTWPRFEISHLGFSTQIGRFNKTDGKIVIDAATKTGSIDIKVDTASIDMGLEKWDTHLKSPDFFNVEKFPSMYFKSSKLKFDGDKLVGADGELTLLGVTKPVSLNVSGYRCGNHPMTKKAMCGGEVTTTIKRSDFGMGYALPAVGDEVKITIPVEAYKDA
ncbi:MAG: YceI family protein [Burkholderiales bacterium]